MNNKLNLDEAIKQNNFSALSNYINESINVLKEKGAENVLVSLGSEGAVLLAADGKVYRQSAFKVKAINTVGSGDSMIAGFLAGCEKGYENALKLGAAAGAATAALPALATKEKIEEILNG